MADSLNLAQAIQLIRHAYLAEIQNTPRPDLVAQYEAAEKSHPVTMKLAHVVFAFECSKTS